MSTNNTYIRTLGSVLLMENDSGSIFVVKYVHWDGEKFNYGYGHGDTVNSMPSPCMPSPFWLPNGSLHLGKTWAEVCEKTGFAGMDNPFDGET